MKNYGRLTNLCLKKISFYQHALKVQTFTEPLKLLHKTPTERTELHVIKTKRSQ